MRVPSAGRRRLSAAIAVASACAVTPCSSTPATARRSPAPAAASVRRPRRSTTRGYLAVADAPAAAPRRALERSPAPLRPGPGRHDREVNADLLLVHAVAAQRGIAAPRAPTPARARSRASSPARRSGPSARRPAPTRRSPARAGSRTGPHRPPSGLRHRGRRRPRARLPRARRARPRRPPTSRRIRDEIHRVATSRDYALAGAAAEPDQLVLRDVRRRRDRQRRRARRSPTGMARQLARFLAGVRGAAARRRQPRPRAALPLPAARGPARRSQRRLGRVREHRPELLALLRAGARRPACARPRSSGCCASGCGACSAATGRTAAT